MRRNKKEKTRSTLKLACLTAVGLTVFFGSAARSRVSGTDFSARNASDLIYISSVSSSELSGDTGTQETSEPAVVFEQPRFILHAGGFLDDHTITNSLEAFLAGLSAGERVFETDFGITSDGYIICIHDWNIAIMPGYTYDDYPVSYEDFKKTKVYGQYTSMTLEDVVSFMVAYPDIRIVTDSKYCENELLEKIATDYPLLMDRFIIQVYDIMEYDRAAAFGYPNIILTLYNLDDAIKTNPDEVIALIGDRKLWCLTFPDSLADYPGYVDKLLTLGIPLYVHTVNDLDRIDALFEMGITGIYTDLYLTESYGESAPDEE